METDSNSLTAHLRKYLAELLAARERMQGVIHGTPWVIRLAPGAYLVRCRDGEGYAAGSILAACCYSLARIDAAVRHVRHEQGDVFPDVKIEHIRNALLREINETENVIALSETA